MGGTPNTGTQTTTSIPNPEANTLANTAAGWGKQYAAAGGTQLPGFSPIAQFTDPQKAGQAWALQSAFGPQASAANNASAAQRFLTTGAALDPASNPGLASSIAAAQKPIYQNLEENVLPSLRSQATGVGQFGSSRDEIAQGLATRGAEQSAGKVAADLTNANYLNALDQMTKAMGLTPTVQGAQITPATTVSGVGDVQQALDQSNLGYQYQKALFPQENQLATAQFLMSLAGAYPGGTTTANASGSSSPSPAQMALGLGSLGTGLFGSSGALSSLGSLFGGSAAMPTAAEMTGAVGSSMGGINSLLPFLMAVA